MSLSLSLETAVVLLPGAIFLELQYPSCLTDFLSAQRKRVINLDPQVVTLLWEIIKGKAMIVLLTDL